MKTEIDKYITANYQKMLQIAQSKIQYFGRNIEAESMVADAYIYVVNNPPPTKEQIPKYMVQYINTELMFQMSQTNRKQTVQAIEPELRDIPFDPIGQIEDKEEMEQLKKSLPRVLQIVFEVYHERGLTKIQELAFHFNITMCGAYQIRNELFNKIKEFYESENQIS